ncbi:MAG: serine/threonine protein kinase [Pirellulaceae bacterium]|nr:serine/threonine protein kinase [Pirellulaceae bacterium]
MEPARWRTIKSVFMAALDLSPDDRGEYLRTALADRAEDQAEVLKLLQSADGQQSFLESPLGQPQAFDSGMIGKTVGEFRIVRLIGMGGMGAVYEAEQAQPKRRVAVKLLRPGLFSSATLQRLSREAAILGRLQHPGIAQVYSAGTIPTEYGQQPWFAMEYVAGVTLNEFTTQHTLETADKIELLVRLCGAVQHAHERGVIHRDLKPANILLVSPGETGTLRLDGQTPQIKVLDFGVARVSDEDGQKSLATMTGELVGTPGYMSPEQLLGNPAFIDARADVYALGVIGFELLAGQAPFERGSKSIVEFARLVEQNEPKRLGQCNKILRGDLEVIFNKALERDVDRRYASVAELAGDLHRFATHQPILARPPSSVYRTRKFLRRHRFLVGGVVTTVLALLAGIILVAREAQRANAAARESAYESSKATAINNFITNDFLMKFLVAEARGEESTRAAIQHVDQAVANIDQQFIGQPSAEAAVRNEIGTIYYNLRAYDKAEREYLLARQLWESQLGSDHADTLKTLNNLGQALTGQGRHEEAQHFFQIALAGRRKTLGPEHPATIGTTNNLAMCLFSIGQIDEAESMLRDGLRLATADRTDIQKERMSLLSNLGTVLIRKNEIDQAAEMHETVYRESLQTFGWDHVFTWQAATRYAQTLHRGRRDAEAELILNQVLTNVERIGETHVEAITTRRVLARVLQRLNRPQEAIQQLELARQAAQQAPTSNPDLISRIEREIIALQK